MSLKSSSCLFYHSYRSLALFTMPFFNFFYWWMRLPKAFFKFSSPSREERISLLFCIFLFIKLFLCLDSPSSFSSVCFIVFRLM